ncbi:unnamed protein product, partial [Thlaspi arvense]
MNFSMKTLVTFVFSILSIVSFVHCHPKITNTLGYGIKASRTLCFYGDKSCYFAGNYGCARFCDRHGFITGNCKPEGNVNICCCFDPFDNMGPK